MMYEWQMVQYLRRDTQSIPRMDRKGTEQKTCEKCDTMECNNQPQQRQRQRRPPQKRTI